MDSVAELIASRECAWTLYRLFFVSVYELQGKEPKVARPFLVFSGREVNPSGIVEKWNYNGRCASVMNIAHQFCLYGVLYFTWQNWPNEARWEQRWKATVRIFLANSLILQPLFPCRGKKWKPNDLQTPEQTPEMAVLGQSSWRSSLLNPCTSLLEQLWSCRSYDTKWCTLRVWGTVAIASSIEYFYFDRQGRSLSNMEYFHMNSVQLNSHCSLGNPVLHWVILLFRFDVFTFGRTVNYQITQLILRTWAATKNLRISHIANQEGNQKFSLILTCRCFAVHNHNGRLNFLNKTSLLNKVWCCNRHHRVVVRTLPATLAKRARSISRRERSGLAKY